MLKSIRTLKEKLIIQKKHRARMFIYDEAAEDNHFNYYNNGYVSSDLPEELHASSHYKFMKNRVISLESDTDSDIITDGKTDYKGGEKMSEPEVITDDEAEVISDQALSDNENDKEEEDHVEESSMSLNTTGIIEIIDGMTATLYSDESLFHCWN